MNAPLQISARNAGQVELSNYCPRCMWYKLHIKQWPFQFGFPALMFYMEQLEKDYLLGYLAKFEKLPSGLGPFSSCVEPVEFPFRMQAEHPETGVIVSAQPDLLFRQKGGGLVLADLKTALQKSPTKSKFPSFLPQYEIQVIGYSWVVQENDIGDVKKGGLIYCEIQKDSFSEDPLEHGDGTSIAVPFLFSSHEVELDYKRLTRCLKEAKKVWNASRPPRGVDNCKDCMLLNRVFDFEDELRHSDFLEARSLPSRMCDYHTAQYYRALSRGASADLASLGEDLGEDNTFINWDWS
jgi:hypothetical protein